MTSHSALPLHRNDLDRCIDAALGYLRTVYRGQPDNGIACGWYHYLDDPNPGVTASAVALYMFAIAGEPFERVGDVLEYLLAEQAKDDDPLIDGGWAVRTTHGFPVLESTAWVVRALCAPGNRRVVDAEALRRGTTWLIKNQNTDLGWGSYKGCESRVFHTALALLALTEAGADPEVIHNGERWLVRAQVSGAPSWGCVAGGPPTLLHTSLALMAQLHASGVLAAASAADIAEWIDTKVAARIEAKVAPPDHIHVEDESLVEEYELWYPHHGEQVMFTNSLPHFAGPVAVSALMAAGHDPYHWALVDYVRLILQQQTPEGYWRLPRNPAKPSIWAMWPFVHALCSYRARALPTPGTRLTLVKDGAAIVAADDIKLPAFRSLALRGRLRAWMRRHSLSLILWCTMAVSIALPSALLAFGELTPANYLTSLVVPVLLLVFQIVLAGRRP